MKFLPGFIEKILHGKVKFEHAKDLPNLVQVNLVYKFEKDKYYISVTDLEGTEIHSHTISKTFRPGETLTVEGMWYQEIIINNV